MAPLEPRLGPKERHSVNQVTRNSYPLRNHLSSSGQRGPQHVRPDSCSQCQHNRAYHPKRSAHLIWIMMLPGRGLAVIPLGARSGPRGNRAST